MGDADLAHRPDATRGRVVPLPVAPPAPDAGRQSADHAGWAAWWWEHGLPVALVVVLAAAGLGLWVMGR